jgi:hypothetical protein
MVDVTGGGLAESVAETLQAAQSADEWIDLGDVAVNAAVVGIDALGFMSNPIDSLGSSAIGFLIEHLAPLRAALDWTTGDPDSIQNAITGWNDLALTLDKIANDHRPAPERYAPTWINGGSKSAANCTEIMAFRSDQISGASMACVGMAQQTANAGMLIAAARNVIRDMIAEYVWQQLKKAAAKLAFAPFTFGATAGEFVMNAMIEMSRLLQKISRVMTKVVDKLAEISQRLTGLAKIFDKYLGLTRRTGSAGILFAKGTLLPSFTGGVLKFGVEMAKEGEKVDSAERQSDQDAGRVDEMHDQYDAGVNPRIRTDEAKNPEEIEKTPPGQYETEDWWTRRGTL